jgi:hypothetical protein
VTCPTKEFSDRDKNENENERGERQHKKRTERVYVNHLFLRESIRSDKQERNTYVSGVDGATPA